MTPHEVEEVPDPTNAFFGKVLRFTWTVSPDENEEPPTLAFLSAGRTADPKYRDEQTLREVEQHYMTMLAAITRSEGVHTGQGTSNGNPWDFELHFPDGTLGLGEHVLYIDPSSDDAPEQEAILTRVSEQWDPDGDFRKILSSPAVARHVRRVSDWHSDPSILLEESHLVVEVHSLVPALELIDMWQPVRRRTTLTHDEVGDVTAIWIVSNRCPNALLLVRGWWIPMTLHKGRLGLLSPATRSATVRRTSHKPTVLRDCFCSAWSREPCFAGGRSGDVLTSDTWVDATTSLMASPALARPQWPRNLNGAAIRPCMATGSWPVAVTA